MSCSRPSTDRPVVVHDVIHDGMEDRTRSESKKLRSGLERLTRFLEPARVSVSHHHDEPAPEEDQYLSELDDLFGVDVARRLQDEQRRIVVTLELRPLMRLDRVLDCQLMEVELATHLFEFVARRLVEPNPHEGVVVATLPRRLPLA